MLCSNCHREIPETAKVCQYCEASVERKPTEEELEAVNEVVAQLPPEIRSELWDKFLTTNTSEEFVNSIMVGPCPRCKSSNTADCDNDPEINEILLARCYDCGQFWCAECGKIMSNDERFCECWVNED
jgi:hypothetical protein